MALENSDFRTPGQLLTALLEDRGWSQRTLAIVLGMDETGVSRIVADNRPIDAKLAVILEDVFEEPAERFLGLQKTFDLAQARITARPDHGRAIRAKIFGELPIAEIAKRGWINVPDIRVVKNVETELMRFFGVTHLKDIEILPHAAKKTAVSSNPTPTQLAWLYRVKKIAKEMLVARYSPQSVLSAVPKLSALLSAPEEARKVPRILAESGVRFLIVETLPSGKIDGVCFWLNDAAPVIALSMRFDRIDNFWFVLRHELEHVIRLHGRTAMMLDAELEGENAGIGEKVSEEERLANEAAADFCVPRKMMEAFIARKSPIFREADILAFARMIRIHPGLIAGQLRYRTGHYDRFGNHLAKVRSIITPNAITDGWGDVAPLGI